MNLEQSNFLVGQMLTEISNKQERDELIIKYAPLVKNIVGRIALRLPDYINKDDLIDVGIIGLITALKKFDKTKNVPFEVYASFRIRGAILDELRSRDDISRSARDKATKIEKAFVILQKKLKRYPTDEEISSFLNISLDKYYKLLDEAKGVCILSTDDLSPNYYQNYSIYEKSDPFNFIAHNELKEILADAIKSLPEKEKLVLSLYYYEELTLKEIGIVMQLSESRICQIHSKAILKLKAKIKRKMSNEFI